MHSNLGDLLVAAPDAATAVVDGDESIDYAQLKARAAGVADAILAAGAEPGDRVAIFSPRSAQAAAAFFGVLAAGAVAVFVNETLRPRQIEHVLEHSGARLLLAHGQTLARLPRAPASSAGVIDIDLPAGAELRPRARVAGDLAQIIYTSGSTGRPKGIAISHGNLLAGADAVTSYLGIRADDRLASLLPFSFDYGQSQLLCSVRAGAALVIERSPVAARIVKSLQEREVTVLAAVPPLWLSLLGVDAFTAQPLPRLRALTNTGGRLPVPAVRRLRACQPQAELFLMYGLTEAFRSTYLAPERADAKPGSIGRAIPGADVVIVDDEGRPCAPGEVGQLIHRGPTVALGYWRDPEATERVYRPDPTLPAGTPTTGRVVYSGDLARRDEDGDIFFVGREDTMIKTLGYRVSPDEVSEVLYASGQVVEALVTSEPDELRGEAIVAYVVLADGGQVDALEQFAARELPRYLQPSRIVVRDSLHRTPSGKHDPAATARAGS